MNVYLLRHSMAEGHDPVRFPDDSRRPLSARGHEQMERIAQAMRRMDLGIDLVWTSPLVRTRQTTAPVAKALDLEDHVHAATQLAPDGDRGELLDEIAGLNPRPANLLLVGHEPYLSGLLSILTSGGSSVQTKFKKGTLAMLQLSGAIRLGQCATLRWLLPPDLIVKLH